MDKYQKHHPDPSPGLEKTFRTEIARLDGKPDLVFSMRPIEAWCVICQIQLALRHPANRGPTSDIARSFACKVIETLAPDPNSALAQVAAMGWDSRYDQEP